MKKISLLAMFAFSIVFVAGCMGKPEDNDQTMPITQEENVVSTGSDMMSGDDTTSGQFVSTDTTTKTITLAEVANHKTESDCRTAINGTVYDVTAFFGKHPGGDKNLFRVCGIDATVAFERQHGNNKQANNALAGFEIGTLAQ